MKPNLLIEIFSFSYHLSGIPADTSGHNGGFVFDCRFLPNPGREEQFKHLTGTDRKVISYLEEHTEVADFLAQVFAIVTGAVENYNHRGFTHLMVSFGCTGGQHRSVYCAEQLALNLSKSGFQTKLRHAELEGRVS